jgi:cell filamentation protein
MVSDPYAYPGTNVLRNRLNLRDASELERQEAILTAARLMELAESPLPGSYDLAHLRAMHGHIFDDIYPWAGEIRTVAIAKQDEMFALPQHIEPYLSGVLDQLPSENNLAGLDRDPFLDRLSHYLSEINATHPFREGNGRTQRAFIGQLAEQAGHPISWERVDRERNIEASRAAHRGDSGPLRDLLADAVDQRARDDRDREDRDDRSR